MAKKGNLSPFQAVSEVVPDASDADGAGMKASLLWRGW
jgi:hypothetical protein